MDLVGPIMTLKMPIPVKVAGGLVLDVRGEVAILERIHREKNSQI